MQIWCAATASSLMRDAIAVAVSNATINDAVRTTNRLPTVALARTPAGRGRSEASARLPARHDHEVRDRGAVLREHGAPGRARDAEVERVHEEQLDQQVGGVGEHGDHERGLGVLHAAQVARARQREQQRGRAEDADAQVRHREGRHAGRRAHHVDDHRRQREAEHREHEPETDREPAPVDPALRRVLAVAGAELAGHPGRRAVGQEVEHAERGGQHRSGDGQAGERPGPEMPDDRGVGQEVQRLGCERAEGGHRQAGDLAVVGSSGRSFRHHWCAMVADGRG